jgi:hypothetical protein
LTRIAGIVSWTAVTTPTRDAAERAYDSHLEGLERRA